MTALAPRASLLSEQAPRTKVAARKDLPSKCTNSLSKSDNSPSKRVGGLRGLYKKRDPKASSGSSRASSSKASTLVDENTGTMLFYTYLAFQ